MAQELKELHKARDRASGLGFFMLQTSRLAHQGKPREFSISIRQASGAYSLQCQRSKSSATAGSVSNSKSNRNMAECRFRSIARTAEWIARKRRTRFCEQPPLRRRP